MPTRLPFLLLLLTLVPSCSSSSVPDETLEAECDDGLDNDDDGLIDCRDSGCAMTLACTPMSDAGTCGPSTCTTCCRPDGRCASSGDTEQTCGAGGGACESCTGIDICTIAGCAPPIPSGCSLTLPTAGPAVDTCTGADICICPGGADTECSGTGSCELASGRTYRFELDYVYTDVTKPNAESWDAGDGAPDPFAVLQLNGLPQGSPSTTMADTFDAQWFPAPAWTIAIQVGDALRLDAYDEDISNHDWIGGCELASLTAANLRAREFACAATSADIRGYVQPL